MQVYVDLKAMATPQCQGPYMKKGRKNERKKID